MLSSVVTFIRRLSAAGPIVYDDTCTELCPEIARIVLAHEAAQPRSNGTLSIGGWKSWDRPFDWDEPALRKLGDEIELGLAMEPASWAMVNRSGAQHPRHQHRTAAISGVYYVDPGDDDPAIATPTIFETPTGEVSIAAVAGRMVLFPGEMWHRVPVVRGARPRITIAFDVRR